MNEFIGKNVRIYPSDSTIKEGIIQEITPEGVLFKITRYSGSSSDYVVGKLHFISFSARLSFREI